jgi:hypothetical protein
MTTAADGKSTRYKRRPDGKCATGRPPLYEDTLEAVKLMQDRADAYFKECDGKPLLDDDGKPILNKYGEPVIIGAKPYTITGLALALGFTSRQSLLEYQFTKDYVYQREFTDAITRAKAKVEQYAEARLFDKDGANGAKFNLANNFKGWTERTATELSGKVEQGLSDADRALLNKVADRINDK